MVIYRFVCVEVCLALYPLRMRGALHRLVHNRVVRTGMGLGVPNSVVGSLFLFRPVVESEVSVRMKEASTKRVRLGVLANTWRGDDVGYIGIHQRLRREKGKASNFMCVENGCAKPAQDWSYNHKDPAEKYAERDGYVLPFSVNTSFYEPRCKAHHVAIDRPFHVTDNDKQDMCRRYEQGEPQSSIATAYRCSQMYISVVLRALGCVKCRVRDARIREAYASGHFTLAELGKLENLTAQHIGRIAKGVPRPKRIYRTSTPEERAQVRERRDERAVDLAIEFGYSDSHIRAIWRGKLI